MLHWSWVCGVLAARFLRRTEGKKRTVDDGTRTLWGVGLLILLLNVMGVGIAVAVLTRIRRAPRRWRIFRIRTWQMTAPQRRLPDR